MIATFGSTHVRNIFGETSVESMVRTSKWTGITRSAISFANNSVQSLTSFRFKCKVKSFGNLTTRHCPKKRLHCYCADIGLGYDHQILQASVSFTAFHQLQTSTMLEAACRADWKLFQGSWQHQNHSQKQLLSRKKVVWSHCTISLMLECAFQSWGMQGNYGPTDNRTRIVISFCKC